jgi:inner membrane protein
MDNLTHSLVGLAAAKAGLERWSPGATAVCVLAANASDADIAWLIFGDRWSFLQHHRGITHSLFGTLLLALAIPCLFWLVDLALAQLRSRSPRVNLANLLLVSLMTGATHPLLDWTNNYGVRLLLPWNDRWFYGDLVFIVDPFIWLLLGGAVFLTSARSRSGFLVWLLVGATLTLLVVVAPLARGGISDPRFLRTFWISAMIALLIGYRLKLSKRWGRTIPVTALSMLLFYWSGLALIHRQVLNQASRQVVPMAARDGEQIVDLAVMPTLADPLHWQCVAESQNWLYRFDLFLTASGGRSSEAVRYPRPEAAFPVAMALASRDRRAQILLGFARFPVARVFGADCVGQTIVQLADLRYTEPGSQRRIFSLEVPIECPDHVVEGTR